MNKTKFMCFSLLAVAAGALALGAAGSNATFFTTSAEGCNHVGYHYDVVEATPTEAGRFEFWTCCVCHNTFDKQPESGSFSDRAEIYSGAVQDEFILPAGTKYYAKNAQIAGDSNFDPKVEDITTLAKKAITFDFWLKDNGSVGFALFDTGWANVTGDIVFTKTDTGVTANKGTVTAKENNWYTYTLARSGFTGDGLSRATDIGIVAGLWDGVNSTTVRNEVALAVNWSTFNVVDAGVNLVKGNDVDTRMGYSLTKAELEGKALSYNVYFGATGEQTVKISLNNNGWTSAFIADLFLKHTDSGYELRQFDPNGNALPIKATELGDGWVNIKVNAKNLTIAGEAGDTCIVWASPTTGNNGVDLNSFEVVDAVAEEIKLVPGDFKQFGANIATADLISNGAVSFNVKVAAGTTSKVSFMAADWANFGTTFFVADAEGNLSIKYSNGSTDKGAVTKLSDGWYNVVLNEYEFNGDGRARTGSRNITHAYVEQSGITFDGNSFKFCAPHAETGTTYHAQAIDVASWSNPQGVNFSYPKAELAYDTSAIGFEIKPVGDGTIRMTLIADDNNWSNISGEFTITKTGDTVTTSYTNAKIIARATGWYSIYLPAPWVGDGYAREGWSSFAHIYSGSGWSGTSLDINWNSFHLVHNNCLSD